MSGATSEHVFVAVALVFTLLFYPVSKVGFNGLIYHVGRAEIPYATVAKVVQANSPDQYGQLAGPVLAHVDFLEKVSV